MLDTLQRRRQVIWLPDKPPSDPLLIRFAEDFADLLDARHQADYDITYSPSKAEATAAIQQAEDALRALQAAREQCPDQLQAMCVAMVASPGTRQRMTSSS